MNKFFSWILVAVVGFALLTLNLESVLFHIVVSQATTELKSHEDVNAALSARNKWFDDYFTIEIIDDNTFAIGEPRYWQQNSSFLIIGEKKALLFDSGTGVRDITPVIESLTDLPIIVMCSHVHYDHVGNHDKFEEILLADTQVGRQDLEGTLVFSMATNEGATVVPPIPTRVAEDGDKIELGGRTLALVFTPGHTKDSVMLLDVERNQLFSGDFLFEIIGARGSFLPTSSAQDYLASSRKLQTIIEPATRIYAAHNPNGNLRPYGHQDLVDLQTFFEGHDSGWFAWLGKVNDRITATY